MARAAGTARDRRLMARISSRTSHPPAQKCSSLLLTGSLPTARITGEVAGSSEPITTSSRLRSQRTYSKREDMSMRCLEDETAILGRIGFWAGVPDQVVQDSQEAKDSATPKEHFPSRALPVSSALFRPFPRTGPGTFQ